MYRYFYIFFIQVVKVLLPLANPFSKKLREFSAHRNASKTVPQGKVKYWIHAASLGEYEMALPVIEELLIENQLEDILITIFSPSGYTQAVKGPYSSRTMYLPLDTLSNVKQFYKDYTPQKAILVRYDFWYNFINEGQIRGVEFYLINGRFQENHFILRTIGKPYLKLLHNFKQIFTSDQASSSLLLTNNVTAKYSGDTRYDRVKAIVEAAPEHPDIETFKGSRKLLVIGSSWLQEEELIQKLLESKPENLAILIAPHDIQRSHEIAAYLKNYNPKLYTESNFSNIDQVLILDTIGMLSDVYRYADLALIGGGFSGALHNILEPAVWGCHLFFGPQTAKFPEAQNLEDAGFAKHITDRERWLKEVNILIKNETFLNKVKIRAKAYTASQIGATKLVTNNIG